MRYHGEHSIALVDVGDDTGWTCTCGRGSTRFVFTAAEALERAEAHLERMRKRDAEQTIKNRRPRGGGRWPMSHERVPLATSHDAVVYPRRTLTARDESEGCVQCGHPFDPHVVVATVFADYREAVDAPLGGHMWCPESECECHRSWAVSFDPGFDIRERIEDMTRAEAIALGVPLQP